MSQFARRIHSSVEFELEAAQRAERRGAPDIAFRHLERAHVLGQAATFEHVRVHWRMLGWARRQRKVAEAVGQLWRIAGAALATGIGWVPEGNTGGAAISGFRPLPIPPDLKRVLDGARS
jgi:hypothetical protein